MGLRGNGLGGDGPHTHGRPHLLARALSIGGYLRTLLERAPMDVQNSL